jgi:hypothetical protein
MTFDIHQKIFDADGLTLESVAEEYKDKLVDLFEQSPEGQALQEEDNYGRWAEIMLDLGQNYLSVTPPKMSAKDIREILFDLIPRKISATDEQAPEIIRELQAFWSFLQREFQLSNAAICLAVFNDEATQRLKEEMSNPANFGMAKSFVMEGFQRGFDMRSQEGIDEWMRTYNAELMTGKKRLFSLAGWLKQMISGHSAVLRAPEEEDDEDADIIDEPDEDLSDLVSRSHPGIASRSSRKASTKQRARMAKASRKKNRRKK